MLILLKKAVPMSRKKILLLNPPADKLYLNDNYCSFSSKAGYSWPPIDLLVQSGILAEQFTVNVLDAIAMRLDTQKAARIIEDISPDAIFFVTGTASWKQNFSFLERLKGTKPVTITASGGNLLFEADRLLREHAFLDAILMDFTTDALSRYFGGEGDAIPNLIYKRDGVILAGARSSAKEAISYPAPLHDLFPLKKYSLPYARLFPLSRILASIGCPYRCTFCLAAQMPYRVRDINNVIQEFYALDRYGIHEIDFCDPTFTAMKDRTIELCSAILATGMAFHWSCNSRVDTVDETQLELMKKSGCHTILFGVESGSQVMLDRYAKGITLDEIRQAFRLCRSAGIETLAYFIVGLPGETRESARETIDLAKKLAPAYVSFDIATPDFGTQLLREARHTGLVPESLDSFDSTGYPVIEIGALSKEEVWKLRNRAHMSFYLRPGYIIRRLLQVRSLSELRALASMGLRLMLTMLDRR